ncbi:hypothetical protein CR513_62913, partial [Mucuna pruriens]
MSVTTLSSRVGFGHQMAELVSTCPISAHLVQRHDLGCDTMHQQMDEEVEEILQDVGEVDDTRSLNRW